MEKIKITFTGGEMPIEVGNDIPSLLRAIKDSETGFVKVAKLSQRGISDRYDKSNLWINVNKILNISEA